MSIIITALLVVWAIVAMFMILVILMQRPKSEGLGAAFGGGVTENIFGAQTTNVLVKFTSYLATLFFILTFALSILYAHQSSTKSVLRQELMKGATAPATPPTTAQSPAAIPAGPAASSPVASVAPTANVPASQPAATAPASPEKP
jgi:preprotein translocase subunit SecG